MKCFIAIALVALVSVATEGSVAPVTYYSPGLVPYPYSYAYPYAYQYNAYPNAVPRADVVNPQQAYYTAVTPGSYHQALLPGHTVSQQAVNVQPAPGTV